MSERRAARPHPWFAIVIGPRPSEEAPAEEEQDPKDRRRRLRRSLARRR